MSKDLIIALLSLVAIGSLAAVFILWAKLDEQKKLTQEEREKRWYEISRADSIEKEKDAEIYELESEIRNLEWDNDCLQMQCDRQQDKLSALLCPTNNHVWVDGICTKCGRMHENRSD